MEAIFYDDGIYSYVKYKEYEFYFYPNGIVKRCIYDGCHIEFNSLGEFYRIFSIDCDMNFDSLAITIDKKTNNIKPKLFYDGIDSKLNDYIIKKDCIIKKDKDGQQYDLQFYDNCRFYDHHYTRSVSNNIYNEKYLVNKNWCCFEIEKTPFDIKISFDNKCIFIYDFKFPNVTVITNIDLSYKSEHNLGEYPTDGPDDILEL